MKRFFLVTALSVVAAAIVSIMFNSLAIVCSIVFVIIALCYILYYKFKINFIKSIVCFSLIFPLAFAYFSGYIKSRDKLNDLVGTSIIINGTLTDEPTYSNNYYIYILKPDKGSFGDIDFAFKIRLKCKYKVDANCYDRLRACIDISELYEEMKYSYYSDNIMLGGKLRYCAVYPTENKPIYYDIKTYITNTFSNNSKSQVFGIPIAILTGDKSYLTNAFYRDIKATGMAHIMAVSGFHISVICISIVTIMQKLKSGKKLSSIIGIFLLIILSGVAGFTGSILRAGLMYLVMFLGELFSRRGDSLNSLGFAITVLTLYNPYNIFNISLLLSTFGTLGILCFSPTLTKLLIGNTKPKGFFKKIYSYIMTVIIISLSAGVAVMPITLYLFGYVSVISVFANLFVTIPVYVNIFSAIIYALVVNIPYISNIVRYVLDYSSVLFKEIIEFFGNFNITVLYSDDIILYIILGIIIIFICLMFIFRKNLILCIVIPILSCVSIAVCVFFQNRINLNTHKLAFIPAEKGLVTVAQSGDEFAIITSSADSYALSEAYYYVYNNLAKSIEFILITSNDTDVLNTAISLTERINVEEIIVCNENTSDLSLNYLDFTLEQSDENYNVYIDVLGETVVLDNCGTAVSDVADYILTDNPMVSYKINGNNPKYIINCGYDYSVAFTGYIAKRGGSAAVLSDFGAIVAEKYSNNLLKFKR